MEVVDDGKAPEVPTIQVSVNEFNELDATTIPNSNDYIVKPDSTKLWATFPTMNEFKELKSRVERLEKRIKEWDFFVIGVSIGGLYYIAGVCRNVLSVCIAAAPNGDDLLLDFF